MNVREILGVKFVNAGIMETVENGMRLMEERKTLCGSPGHGTASGCPAGMGGSWRRSGARSSFCPRAAGFSAPPISWACPERQNKRLGFCLGPYGQNERKGHEHFHCRPGHGACGACGGKNKSRYPGIIAAGSDGGFCTSEIELTAMINQAAPGPASGRSGFSQAGALDASLPGQA